MAQPSTTRPPRPRRGDELELTIESLAHGGAGVARADGYVVFVRGAVPGDRVRAAIGKSKRSFAEARVVELLEPSPDRIEPRARTRARRGRCCPTSASSRRRSSQVRDALERLGGFEAPPVEPIVPAVEPLRYRNKLEYSFGEDEDGELVLGFHRPGRWDVIDDVRDDMLASERVDELREAVKAWCREEGLSAYDRARPRRPPAQPGRARGPPHRAAAGPAGHQPRATSGADELAAALPADSVLWTQIEGVAETTRGGKTKMLKGPPCDRGAARARGPTLRFRISPDAFFQTNTEMAERLYALAAELAGLTGRERVFDLYCGIGTIALALALEAGEVWGVEIVERAVADAIENAKLNGVDNASFFAGDVRTAMRPLLEQAGKPDVVVVDPPRAGLSQKMVRRVLEAEAQRIVYVSCNPTTLAPNARQMVDAGYELKTCGRWTCSRRRRTSSAWRCWSAALIRPSWLLAVALALTGAPAAAARPRPPVVMIVFDEFPADAIAHADGRIDARRFPGFAALARHSTWFPNATPCSTARPRRCRPSSRRRARPHEGPSYLSHPRSVFTLLGGMATGSREREATTVCPPRICPLPGSVDTSAQTRLSRGGSG